MPQVVYGLASLAAAQELLRQLPMNGSSGIVNLKSPYGPIRLGARRSIGRGDWSYSPDGVTLTGPVKLWAIVDERSPDLRSPAKEAYLRTGWTEESFVRAAARLHHWALHAAHINRYRNQTHALWEMQPQHIIDAAEAEGERTGRTIVYTEMSVDDCLFWQAFLERFMEPTIARESGPDDLAPELSR